MSMITCAFSKSVESTCTTGTVMAISASLRFLRSFCSTAIFADCRNTLVKVLSCERGIGSPCTLTAITTSACIPRTTSVGRLLMIPPSISTRSSHSTGVKIAGMAIVARNALGNEPRSRMNPSPDTRSVETQRKGIGRSSKVVISE